MPPRLLNLPRRVDSPHRHRTAIPFSQPTAGCVQPRCGSRPAGTPRDSDLLKEVAKRLSSIYLPGGSSKRRIGTRCLSWLTWEQETAEEETIERLTNTPNGGDCQANTITIQTISVCRLRPPTGRAIGLGFCDPSRLNVIDLPD